MVRVKELSVGATTLFAHHLFKMSEYKDPRTQIKLPNYIEAVEIRDKNTPESIMTPITIVFVITLVARLLLGFDMESDPLGLVRNTLLALNVACAVLFGSLVIDVISQQIRRRKFKNAEFTRIQLEKLHPCLKACLFYAGTYGNKKTIVEDLAILFNYLNTLVDVNDEQVYVFKDKNLDLINNPHGNLLFIDDKTKKIARYSVDIENDTTTLIDPQKLMVNSVSVQRFNQSDMSHITLDFNEDRKFIQLSGLKGDTVEYDDKTQDTNPEDK